MIMCENCKEWFHGKCMNISKPTAEKISTYLCLACSLRKDSINTQYHLDFFNYKRIEYPKFLKFLEEYELITPELPEYEILLNIKAKMEIWTKNYKQLLIEITEFSKNNMILLTNQIISCKSFSNSNISDFNCLINSNNNGYLSNDNNENISNLPRNITNNANKINSLNCMNVINNQSNVKIKNFVVNDTLEKKIIDLYLESEGFPVDNLVAKNLIVILKYHDWFKDSFKCVESKKFSEKINKKVISNYQSTFILSNINIIFEEEKLFFEVTNPVAKIFYNLIYNKYNCVMNTLNSKMDKQNLEIVDEILLNIDKNKILSNLNESEKFEIIKKEIEKYENWKNNLEFNLNKNITLEIFKNIKEKSKEFSFKTSFLEKFKIISQNFMIEQVDYYFTLLFEDTSRNKKKEKLEKNSKIENYDQKIIVEKMDKIKKDKLNSENGTNKSDKKNIKNKSIKKILSKDDDKLNNSEYDLYSNKEIETKFDKMQIEFNKNLYKDDKKNENDFDDLKEKLMDKSSPRDDNSSIEKNDNID